MMRCSLVWLRPRIMNAKEALADIRDGARIVSGGFGYTGTPFELLEELRLTQSKNLDLIISTVAGEEFGVGPLATAGQLRRVTACYMGGNKVFADCFMKGKVEVELCPMGSLIGRVEAGGTGVAAFYTPTGYNTAVALGELPRRMVGDGSSRVAQYTAPRETRFIDGKWCCLETALHADFALVKAWKADRSGNLLFRGTARNFNHSAAKCGKVCIAQVEEIVESGALDPNEIHVSGVYVDRLVHVPSPTRPIELLVTRGEGDSSIDHESPKARMARRAALEVQEGMILNLGIGTPTLVGSYIPKEANVLLMAGNGLLGVGPFPLPDEVDPDILNASKQTVTVDKSAGAVFLDSLESLGMIRGGYVDVAMMGTMEVAENGDLANWMVPGKRISGMGGGMELAQSGCRTVILTHHTNGDGSPKILHRCKAPLTAHGAVDMIITELAVFELVWDAGTESKALCLVELAPGITVDMVRSKTEASFTVSPDLKPMQQAPVLH